MNGEILGEYLHGNNDEIGVAAAVLIWLCSAITVRHSSRLTQQPPTTPQAAPSVPSFYHLVSCRYDDGFQRAYVVLSRSISLLCYSFPYRLLMSFVSQCRAEMRPLMVSFSPKSSSTDTIFASPGSRSPLRFLQWYLR